MGVGWYSWGLSERWQLGKLGVPFAPPSLSPQAGAELGKESLPMPNAFWGHPGVGGTVGPLSRPAGNLAEELALGLAGALGRQVLFEVTLSKLSLSLWEESSSGGAERMK